MVKPHNDTNARVGRFFHSEKFFSQVRELTRIQIILSASLWLWNLYIAANLSRRELVDLTMARQAGCLSIDRVPPNRVSGCRLRAEKCSSAYGGAVRDRAVSRLDLQRLADAVWIALFLTGQVTIRFQNHG